MFHLDLPSCNSSYFPLIMAFGFFSIHNGFWAFHHEPCFLDFWSSQVLSSDSPAVQHPLLIKAPGTGHDLQLSPLLAFIWNEGDRFCQYYCLFSCDDRQYFCVRYSAVCSLLISSDVPFHPVMKKGDKHFCSSLPNKVSSSAQIRVRPRAIEVSNLSNQPPSEELSFFAKNVARWQKM